MMAAEVKVRNIYIGLIITESASKANDIPQSYFIVRNDDLIKVTHLLVYKADVSGQK